ncbi:peroxisomal acyl-coenzyme A oxidase 1-like [Hordeum vulgare subsp. vulgare]|uniref:peroxisomal acyl-coenzyme A oxidase 1-like n=1 Tax=Hordeum vulgare subsp. vulgare TaxID=112509 RepID=UPI000B47F67A|nr:peroxisomal acyl-coenzyme A oxidase 1-like [Hordeum vulgare subsp. vulgare]
MGNIQHLMQCKSTVNTAEDWLNPATVKEVFEARALRMVVNCAQNISKAPSQEEGFYELSPDLLEAAVAHVQLIIVTKFIEKMQEDIPGPGVKEQLQKLCSIYALHLLHKHLARERATAHFDVDAMKVAWAGSRHAVEVADRMARLVASDPISTAAHPVSTRGLLSTKVFLQAYYILSRVIRIELVRCLCKQCFVQDAPYYLYFFAEIYT